MSKSGVNSWYGWRPDKPDARDYRFAAPRRAVMAMGGFADLSGQFPDCYDQGELGSCTANAIAGALEFDERLQKEKKPATPSRLFIYFNERVMEGTVSEDAGAEIRDGIKSVVDLGAPPETKWPYKIDKFATKPPKTAYSSAKAHQALIYERVPQTETDLRACLASGFPVVFGFTCYESFESKDVARSGIVPMPGPDEKVVGGHAVVLCGYDDKTRYYKVRNSWGENWGQTGYFEMPYDYVHDNNLCDDFWCIRKVEGK